MKKFILLLPILSIIFVSFPLLNRQFFAVHDDQQVARIYLMSQALSVGQFPVRWVDHLGFGYGYPLFIFYPPLIYYLGSIFFGLGLSLILSVKLIIFLSFLFSLIGMYFLLRKFFSHTASILGACIYILTSYRAVDIYVRGALSEAFSFVFLPLIFLYIFNIFQSPKRKDFVFLSLSFAGLILTHTLTALGFVLFMSIWILCLFFKTKNLKSLALTFLSLLTSVGISCFASLPSLVEKKFTLVDGILLTELADYRIHFVYLRQLWSSAWGYGGSLPELNDGLSFEIGKLLIVCTFLVVMGIAVSVYKMKKAALVYIFPILLIVSIYMTLKYSKPIWTIFPPLAYLQFPWRFLAFVTFFTPFIFALIIDFASRINHKITFVVLTMIFTISVLEVFGRFQPKELKTLNDSNYLTELRLDWATSRSSFEYIPKGVVTKISSDNTTIPDIDPDRLPTSGAKIIKGEAIINELQHIPGKQKYEITASTPTTVQFSTFDFPGWTAKVNGTKTAINSDNPLRLITLEVPQGRSKVELYFAHTPIRLISEIISLISLFLLVLLLFFNPIKNVIRRHVN